MNMWYSIYIFFIINYDRCKHYYIYLRGFIVYLKIYRKKDRLASGLLTNKSWPLKGKIELTYIMTKKDLKNRTILR